MAISHDLVNNRFAACANVLGPVKSVYRWCDKVQEDQEFAILAKTQPDLVPKLSERVEMLHSYECPCVLSIPIEGGFVPFLHWIASETKYLAK